MPYLSEKEVESLERMAEVMEKIQSFAEPLSYWQELEANELRLDAILMNFINLGECILRLPESFFASYPEIERQKIRGLRHIVAHDYWGIDVEMIWQIIQEDLPSLSLRISQILNDGK